MAFEQPKRRRFGQLFNRSQKKRKNRILIQTPSSEKNLLSNQHSTNYYDSRILKRSIPGKRHLNTDGSSFDQLDELCKKLPKTVTKARSNDKKEDNENKENSLSAKNDFPGESQRTLKSDGSSGRKLQLILEKLILEESKQNNVLILPQNNMHEKKISSYEIRTPPLETPTGAVSGNFITKTPTRSPNESSPNRRTPNRNSLTKSSTFGNSSIRSTSTRHTPNRNNVYDDATQQEVPTTPNSQQKFRFEMEDSNEQAKLYLSLRKRKKKQGNKQTANQGDVRMLQNCDLLSLEVKSDSIVSVSSCSIDSVLEGKGEKRRSKSKKSPKRTPKRSPKKSYMEPQKEKNSGIENVSCNASHLADELKAVFANSYGIASTWLGSCVPVKRS